MKPRETAEFFSRFFQDEIENIWQGCVDGPSEEFEGKERLGSHVPRVNTLSRFPSLSGAHILNIIQASKPATAAVDPV